jgi:hypothetical protein
MKIHREWQDEPELFEGVVNALEPGISVLGDSEDANSEMEAEVLAYDEQGPYGERGRIVLCLGKRQFSLELHEIV